MAVRLSSITDLPESSSINDNDLFIIALNISGKYLSRKALLKHFPTAKENLNGFMSANDKAKLDGIEENAIKYTLPIANNTVLGGIKVGANLAINSVTGVLSARPPDSYNLTAATATNLGGIKVGYNEIGENKFAVKLTTDGNDKNLAYVEVPNFTATGTKVGLVQKPTETDNTKFLRSDGSWQIPPNIAYTTVSKEKDGLCPALPNETTTTKYLRLDGTWTTPPTSTINFDDIYPLGSIYISAKQNLPSVFTTNNRQWTRVAVGQCLFGIAEDGKYLPKDGVEKHIGDTVEAGLPNITGEGGFGWWSGGTGEVGSLIRGAFNMISDNGYGINDGSTTNNDPRIDFDASRCDSIYGNSRTVQPPALLVSMWERIA